ncbi:hypothetical protein BZA70DRAFT_106530 [Myxozyma melibiosi]|uniref:OTU domain-containing protein n=1 Tax=Myxozyma melibiosi TaxID=54550 RepID=A0ABR1F9K7_9ASCO
MSGDAEFPLLRAQGLYASQITGDGNCLFRALADQLYGDPDLHFTVRRDVVEFLRANKDQYIGFLPAALGVAVGRKSQRRAASAASANSAARDSAQGADKMWESYLENMSKNGVYGDNLEIVAFARRFQVDVKIHLTDFAYVVPSGDVNAKRLLHIAYHQWEHYSSIRNIDGPHSGLPEVKEKIISRADSDKLLESHTYCQPWMEKVVLSSIPDLDGPKNMMRVRDAIEKFKGDVNQAVDFLFELKLKEDEATDGSVDKIAEAEKNGQVPDLGNASGSGSPGVENGQVPAGDLQASSSPQSTDSGSESLPLTPPDIPSSRSSSRYATRKQAALNRVSQTGGNPKPKRKETARERKERQKRESKERRQRDQRQVGETGGVTDGSTSKGFDTDPQSSAAASKVVFI